MYLKTFTVFVLVHIPLLVFSDDNSEHLYDKAVEYQQYKKKSSILKKKSRDLLSNIYRVNRIQRKLAYSKSDLIHKRDDLTSRKQSLKKEIKKVSKEIIRLKKQMIVRLRALGRYGGPSIFGSIFGSEDAIEMDRNARILYKISELDLSQLKKYRGMKKKLAYKQKKLNVTLAELVLNTKKLEKKEIDIKKSYERKMQILSKIGDEERKVLRKIQNIRNSAKNFAKSNQLEDLAVLFDSSMYEKKGNLKLPSSGQISKKYGLLDLPYDRVKIYNKGWFLTTLKGREVRSIFKGKVVYKGYIGDYGRVVIVNHGDHYYSVYGSLSEIYVSIGDDVDEASKIASTGMSRIFGSGVYIEIRHFSQPQDPKEWFSDSKIKISALGDSV